MELILFWRICQFDRYRNISLSLKNVMFVMFVIAQLVLGGVFCGNQSNCRICILIGECWNGVESLEILELVELPGKAGMSGMSVMTGVPLEGLVAECLECPVEHTDGFLEDLLAFYA